MNNQVKLIDQTKLLEGLKKELEFCIKEKFNEKNTRFYLGRETVLTDIIKQIESGTFDHDPLPTIKPGDGVRHEIYGNGIVRSDAITRTTVEVDFDLHVFDVPVGDLEVVE